MKAMTVFLLLAAVALSTIASAQKKDPAFCRFSSDDQLIVSDEIGNVTRFDLQTGAPLESYKIETDPKSKLVTILLTQDRKYGVALFRNTNLWIWEVSGGKVVATIPKVREANSYGKYVVFLRDGSIFRYDITTQSEEKLAGSRFMIPPSQATMAVVDGGNISIYGTDAAARTIALPPNTDKIDFSRDGMFVVTATPFSSNSFSWSVLKAEDGSKFSEKRETFSQPVDKLSRFGFTWQGRISFLAEKNFAMPNDQPANGLYEADGRAAGEGAAADSDPGTWSSAGIVIVSSNVGAPDRSWMIPKDPDEKFTPATDASVSPDGSKLVVMRKKSNQIEIYDLKDTEKLTQKAMLMSMEYNKPRLLKKFPIP